MEESKVTKEKKIRKFPAAIKGFVKKHKKLTIFLSIVVIAVIVAIIFVIKKKKAGEVDVEIKTAMVEKHDLKTTVSASGKLIARESKDIMAPELASAGAKVMEINVKVGDVISEGDIICTIDTKKLEEELSNLEAQLKVRKIKTKNSMDNTLRNLDSIQTAGINRTYRNVEAVNEAQRILDTKKGELAEAQRIYDKEYNIYNSLYSEDKYYSLKEKEANGSISDSEKKELSSQETARNALHSIKSQVDSAQASVNSAQDSLTKAQETYTDTVKQDINSIEDANDNLENIKADNSIADVDLEKSIRDKKEQIAAAKVVAPFSGTVTLCNYHVGDNYKGDTIIKLEDASSFRIETGVDEYDICDIKVGQKILFKTNATGSEELNGVITEVAPRANATVSTGQGQNTTASTAASSYKVMIDVTSKSDKFRMDMTAKINIITEEALNVFAVPSDAISKDEEGRSYIRVQDMSMPAGAADMLDGDAGKILPTLMVTPDGEEIPEKIIYVEVGMESNYYTEIKSSELKEGMTVILSNDANAATIDDLMIQVGPMGGM